MNQLQLKICGMRDSENILAVSELEPDWLGFIFYASSPRYVGTDFQLPVLNNRIKRVGVFVNEVQEVILAQIVKYRLNAVQLHGAESVAYCEGVRKQNVKVIKVFHIDADFDFETTVPYQSVSDYFLFDTRGKSWGGNAFKFDWQLLTKYTGETPFFLSGGISPADCEAIRSLSHRSLIGIDVNSGVESAPGMKDIEKVQELISSLNH